MRRLPVTVDTDRPHRQSFVDKEAPAGPRVRAARRERRSRLYSRHASPAPLPPRPPMDPRYRAADLHAVPSPTLLFFADLIRHNLRTAVRLAGGPARLRPHVKTHKTREIVRLCLEA